jgi:hypothetical protein
LGVYLYSIYFGIVQGEVKIPRNSSGVYSIPIAAFAPGGIIKASDHNSNYSDIAAALTQSLATTGVSIMTGPIKSASGTAPAPSITFASSAGTGFYLAGTNQIGWSANGSPGATFNSDTSVNWSGAQSFGGSVSITGALTASGALSGSSLSTTGAGSIGTNLLIGGALGVGSNLAVSGAEAVSGKLSLLSTDSMALANGTTAQRNVAPSVGDLRYNSTLGAIEYYNGAWIQPASFGNASVTGLVVKNNAVTPNTKIDVTANQALLTNTAGNVTYITSPSVTIDLTTTGANGIDTGTILALTWYYVYLISNSVTTAGLVSLSATAPTLPTGYVFSIRVGAMRTDGASALYRTLQKGPRAQYLAPIVLGSGSAGSLTVPTWVGISVSGAGQVSPSTATSLVGLVNPMSASSYIMAAPNNSYGAYNTTNVFVSAVGGTAGNVSNYGVPFSMILESNSIYWASNGASNYVACTGWVDSVNCH